MEVRLGAVLAAIIVSASAQAATAGRLDIKVQASLPGDGQTEADIRVESTNGKPLSKVELTASAGTIAIRDRTDTVWTYALTAPRVASVMKIELRASARVGKRKAKARGTIKVETRPKAAKRLTGKGAFAIRRPEFLRVGNKAELRFRRLGDEAPIVSSNLGSLSRPRPGNSGKDWVVDFEASSLRYPHVVVIAAASSNSKNVDWVSIPVRATPDIVIRTERGATVTISAGDEPLGPFVANRRGKLEAGVEVGPGVTQALIQGRDRAGNQVRQQLPLNVPASSQSLLLCPPNGATNYLITTEPTGTPRTGLEPVATSSEGSMSRFRVIAPGVYGFDLTKASTAAKQIKIEARSEAPTPVSESCTRKAPEPLPSDLKIALPADFKAGDKPVRIEVELVFERTVERTTTELTVQTSRGKTSRPKRLSGRTFEVMWTLPNSHDGQADASVEIKAGGISSSKTLKLTHGPLAALKVTSTQDTLRADGSSTTRVTVLARDQWGNPVNGLSPSAASKGRTSAFASSGSGAYQSTYTAPQSHSERSDRIAVRAGEATSTLQLRLRPELRARSTSANVGIFTNRGGLLGGSVSAQFIQALPFLSRRIGLGLKTGYFYANDSGSLMESDTDLETSLRAVPLLARAQLVLPLGPLRAVVATHAGVLWSDVAAQSELIGTRTASTVGLAVQGTLGLEYPLGRGSLGVEAGYMHSRIDEQRAAGSAIGLTVDGGYRFDF